MSYQKKSYWEKRLAQNWSLKGVGHIAYSERYNCYLYKAKTHCLSEAISNHKISLKGVKVLDVGSGTGFWIEWYFDRGAKKITAIEISPTAVRRLRKKFPQMKIYQGDICRHPSFSGKFKIVNAIDVLFHITEKKEFSSALSYLIEQMAEDGYLVITDLLGKEDDFPSEHVCFHSLVSYQQILSRLNCQILSIHPLYGLLNGKLFDKIETVSSRLRSKVRKAEEILAPVFYFFDRVWIPSILVDLKLMLVQKRKR